MSICRRNLFYVSLARAYQVLFRLFYCCGLRLAEGCYLKRLCVDLTNGTVKILHSKGSKDRIVFLSEDVLEMCREYDPAMQKIVPNREWFFPGWRPHQAIRKTSVDKKFTEFWNKTSLPAR